MDERERMAGTVRQFVIENFLFGGDTSDFSDSDSFLEKGLIDSIGIMTLIEHVKGTYEMTIEDEELVPENWDSVERIVEFIHAKQHVSV